MGCRCALAAVQKRRATHQGVIIRHPGEKFVLRYANEWTIVRAQWTRFYLDPAKTLPYRPYHPHGRVEPLTPRAAHECDAGGGSDQLCVDGRGLGVSALKRSPNMPYLVTVTTQGLPGTPGFEAPGGVGIAAPSKTPPAILDQLNRMLFPLTPEQPRDAARWIAAGNRATLCAFRMKATIKTI